MRIGSKPPPVKCEDCGTRTKKEYRLVRTEKGPFLFCEDCAP